jgi:hypothetical protein
MEFEQSIFDGELLRSHLASSLPVTKGRVLTFSSSQALLEVFQTLLEEGVLSAPVWDETTSEYCGFVDLQVRRRTWGLVSTFQCTFFFAHRRGVGVCMWCCHVRADADLLGVQMPVPRWSSENASHSRAGGHTLAGDVTTGHQLAVHADSSLVRRTY